jgi:hypothetical protein
LRIAQQSHSESDYDEDHQADLIGWLANQKKSNIKNKLTMKERFRLVRPLSEAVPSRHSDCHE